MFVNKIVLTSRGAGTSGYRGRNPLNYPSSTAVPNGQADDSLIPVGGWLVVGGRTNQPTGHL